MQCNYMEYTDWERSGGWERDWSGWWSIATQWFVYLAYGSCDSIHGHSEPTNARSTFDLPPLGSTIITLTQELNEWHGWSLFPSN